MTRNERRRLSASDPLHWPPESRHTIAQPGERRLNRARNGAALRASARIAVRNHRVTVDAALAAMRLA